MEQQDVDLLTELIQTLTQDVTQLKKMVASQPPQAAPVDSRPTLEKVANAINGLRQGVDALKQQKAAAIPTDIIPHFDALGQLIRQRPEYRLSQYVRYGGYVFSLLVIALMGMSWLAFSWKSERDEYQPAYEAQNWRLRYTKQASPDFYAYMEGVFAKEPAKVQQWTLEQEQADQKRALAREAAEQAKAMTAQADQLEGKDQTKGKKKERL